MGDDSTETYKLNANGKQYTIQMTILNSEIHISLKYFLNNLNREKLFTCHFTLNELVIVNKLFKLVNSIYQAKEIIKICLQQNKITISEESNVVNIMFNAVFGNEISPFNLTLYTDEIEKTIHNSHTGFYSNYSETTSSFGSVNIPVENKKFINIASNENNVFIKKL